GCAFALSIDEQFSVTLLEKKSKTELGPDWIDGFDKQLIEDYEISKYVEKLSDSFGQRFYSPDGMTSIAAPLSERIEIDRKILAQNLISALNEKPNITFIENATVKSALIENNFVVGIKYKLDNQEHTINSKLVVDATGYPAVLRKNLAEIYGFTKDIEKIDTFLTFRKYITRPTSLTTNEHKIFFGRHRGISWINSEMEDLVDLFAGVPSFADHINPKEIVQELENQLKEECHSQIDLKPVRANYPGIIPTRRCLDSFCENGFLLIGDSACQVEPLSGSGIASGMLAGYLAAKIVNSLLQSGQKLTKANLWQYNYEWIQKTGAQYASIDIFRLFLLSRSEEDYNFLIRKRIITENDFKNSLTGKKIKLGFIEILRRLWRGWTRLGLLLALKRAINDANKFKTIYLNYPESYDKELFEPWQQKKEDILRKYYKKVKNFNK
ncbi:MAG: NAD(P)/FAD-dependent oxidoreductase, partial [Candidatus Helarchaeota archaeon]|nr:NAD(P)/FAD-dependent oxidoreductase [Candidatus Helarchaeota archaeon]